MPGPSVDILLKARDEATGVLRRVSGEVNAISGTVARLSTGLGVWGAVGAGVVSAAGAVVAAGKKFADTVEALDRVRAATGLALGEVQSLQQVFVDAGLGAEAAGDAAAYFAKQIGEGNPLLEKYGIRTRNVREGLLQLSEIVRKSNDVGERQLLVTKLLGKSMGEATGTVAALGTVWSSTHQRMDRAGKLIRDEIAPSARHLDEQLDQLALSWQGAWTRMTAASIPAAAQIVGSINQILAKIGEVLAHPAITVPVRLVFEPADLFALQRNLNEAIVRWRAFSATVASGEAAGHEILQRAGVEPIPAEAAGLQVAHRAGVRSTPEPPAVDVARLKRLKEIAEVLRVSLPTAQRYLEVLEAIETEKKREALRQGGARLRTLGPGEHGPLTEAEAALGPGLREEMDALRGDTRSTVFDPRAIDSARLSVDQRVREMAPAFDEVRAAIIRVQEEYGPLMREILSTNGVIQASFGAMYAGIDGGFAQVALNFTNRLQTIRSAALTVLNSVASQYATTFARISSAWIFRGLLGAVGGPFGAAAGVGVEVMGGGTARAGAPRAERSAGAPVAVYNVTINGYDVRSAYMDLTSPNGQLRKAIERLHVSREY